MHKLETLVKTGASNTVDELIKKVDIKEGGSVEIQLGNPFILLFRFSRPH